MSEWMDDSLRAPMWLLAIYAAVLIISSPAALVRLRNLHRLPFFMIGAISNLPLEAV